MSITKLGLLICLSLVCDMAARAEPVAAGQKSGAPANHSSHSPEIDSEHLFGFTQGSDIGEKGEVEGEVESTGGFGKRAGRYAVTSTAFELKYLPVENFRISPSFALSHQDIAGVPGLDDIRAFSFQGAGLEFKYRLLDRTRAPFGLTIGIDPHWDRVDPATGEAVEQYGIDTLAAFDKELVANRIFAAFNVLYDAEWKRPLATGEWEKSSTLGLSAAIADQFLPGFFLGAEVRYLRKYDSIALNNFAGEALFVGPTFYAVLSERWNMTLAWNAQIAGRAVGDPSPLDLTNFERNQVRVRFGTHF
jgi:hypothetical protein